MQKLRSLTSFALVSTLAVSMTGCVDETPPFPEGQGQSPNAAARYPAGPYGIDKGAVVANYKFVGFPSPDTDNQALREVQLADFYNPTGDELWPEDSFYGAQPKPKALLISVSAVWCGPCQYENAEILPGEYADLNPKGVEFLLNLADGPTVGEPAETKHLVSWTKKYGTKWPAVIDPSYKLSALFEADAFPANIIVDTRTMTVVDVVAGVPDDKFMNQLKTLVE
jgi:hypothetical protein